MATPTMKSSLSLTRTIHPVGQGAFYSEQFYNELNKTPLLTVVYDCGGNMKELNEQIETIQRLGLIFVSHFHEDHIKGMNKLKETYPDAIIVIPGISPFRFIVDLISNFIRVGSTSSAAILFMLSCLPALKGKKAFKQLPIQGDALGGCHTSGGTIIVPPSNHLLVYTPFEWYYDAFYNEYDTTKEKDLIEKISTIIPSLKEVLANPKDYRDSNWYEENLLPDLARVKDEIPSIKKIYSDVFDGEHNSYSMLVHSYSKDNVVENSDCLYTGDAEKTSGNENIIRSIKPHYIQVPHHGSFRNHNPNYYFRRQIAFISVGRNNQFHHPGTDTLIDLIQKCPLIHVVTEDKKSKFKHKFYLP